MKIAIAITNFLQSGGMERYVLDLVAGLNQKGIRPTIFCSRFDPNLSKQYNVEIVKIFSPKFLGKLRPHVFSWFLKRKRKHFPTHTLIGCNRNVSSDIAICGGTHIGYRSKENKALNFWDKKEIALEKKYYNNARWVVAHSQMMGKELSTYYSIDPLKIKVYYPPIGNNAFKIVDSRTRNKIRTERNLNENDVVFLFPSSGHERKGLPLLTNVFSNSDLPIKLLVVGKGAVDNTSEKLQYLGYINAIEKLYQAADYTILASTYEPFGLVGVESVLCGTPTVLEKDIGSAEVLSKQACIPFDRNNILSLKQAIEFAVQNRKRITDGLSEITYDTSVEAHVSLLLTLDTTKD